MKQTLLLLMTVAVMGAARAVALAWDDPSLTWTEVTAAQGSTTKGSATVALDPTGFTVCLSMTISGLDGKTWTGRWPNFLQIGASTAQDLSVCTDANATVRVTGTVKGSGADLYGPEGMRVTDGDHTLVLSYADGAVQVYWDAQLAVSFVAPESSRFTQTVTTLHWGERHNNNDTTTDVTESMSWTVTGLSYLGSQVADPTVPEPTALALLALGVAGLALRRKVA